MEGIEEVYEFYNNGAEIGRLERGLGVVEFYRSKEIIEKYLNDVVIPACYKGLYHGRIYPYCGGDCVNTAIKAFKEYVRYFYNTYADPELVKQYEETKKEYWKR